MALNPDLSAPKPVLSATAPNYYYYYCCCCCYYFFPKVVCHKHGAGALLKYEFPVSTPPPPNCQCRRFGKGLGNMHFAQLP